MKCQFCQVEFQPKRKRNIFCSLKCGAANASFVRTGSKTQQMIQLKCEKCDCDFTVRNSYHKWKKRRFCSKKCAAKSHLGCKRSKWEALLSQRLKEQFPTLEIIDNDRDVLGLEIDIWMPSLKFAIEWNGAFHYKPIWGNDRLEYQQTNDKKKAELANNQNIHLVVIPAITMNQKRFNVIFDDICIIVSKLVDDFR